MKNIGSSWGEPLFEIAIYRVAPERWHNELAELDAQAWAAVDPYADGLPAESKQRHFAILQEQLRSQIGHFPYGQAIGWLRLVHDGPGPVVKGYAYKLPQRQFQRRFRQSYFNEIGKVLEVSFSTPGISNEEIAEMLTVDIVDTTKRGQVFQGRWPDMAAFNKIAPHTDWRTLLGLLE
ncbi:hypothetical protein [Actinomycetospora sp. CA-084318]|uniref:hypothetical protein n=1 Tax=Actinomycetospora sp. CA-084318 TaxID=3239892 RepID=UPI003D9688CF